MSETVFTCLLEVAVPIAVIISMTLIARQPPAGDLRIRRIVREEIERLRGERG